MSSSRNEGEWIREELSGADFGEPRLNRRFETLSSELAAHPSLPINQASQDWAATKAAYRFFENEHVSSEKILAPHFMHTAERMQGRRRVIVAQDTSALDFASHKKTKHLGFLTTYDDGEAEMAGLMFHTSLAMTEKGVPLGLLSHEIYARERATQSDHERDYTIINHKESFKWIKALRSTLEHTDEAGPEIVIVGDREADIYELIEEAVGSRVELVVRASHDRMLSDEDFGDIRMLDRLGLEPDQGHLEIRLPSTGKRQGRKALLTLRYRELELAGQPRGIRTKRVAHRHDVRVGVIDLREEHPPKGHKPLEWTLLTTLPIKSRADALEVIRIYKMRWTIELYFKSLKTGCNVEKCRLGAAEKVVNYVSVLSVVAWRILWLTMVGRERPEACCEEVFARSEWKALWLQHNRKKIKSGLLEPTPPEQPPTLEEATIWLACQGGYLNRNSDPPPGQIVIWRGWLRLIPATEMYETLQPMLKNEKTHNGSCG